MASLLCFPSIRPISSYCPSLPESARDAYAVRYARCQDRLFPVMRALGGAQLEPRAEQGFLALFALMQKQAIRHGIRKS